MFTLKSQKGAGGCRLLKVLVGGWWLINIRYLSSNVYTLSTQKLIVDGCGDAQILAQHS